MTGRKRNSAKGTETERRAIRILESDGYKVHRTTRSHFRATNGQHMSHSNDFFGCVDLIAKRRGERTRWIQVHAGQNVGAKVAKLKEVPWTEEHDSVEVWQWCGNLPGIDRRTGQPRKGPYFQIYHMDDGFVPSKENRASEQLPRSRPVPVPDSP